MRNRYLAYCKHCDLHNPPESHYMGIKRKYCKSYETTRLSIYAKSEAGRIKSRERMVRYRRTENGQVKEQAYKKSHVDRIRQYSQDHFKAHRAKYYAKCMKYYTKKRKAMPPWLTATQLAEISTFYELAVQLTNQTGILHEVDHIHPINGHDVCGLHVPWNLQVLPASVNRAKSNKLIV